MLRTCMYRACRAVVQKVLDSRQASAGPLWNNYRFHGRLSTFSTNASPSTDLPRSWLWTKISCFEGFHFRRHGFMNLRECAREPSAETNFASTEEVFVSVQQTLPQAFHGTSFPKIQSCQRTLKGGLLPRHQFSLPRQHTVCRITLRTL